jgi:hypothetical protein
MSTISPLCSATGMNSAGEITPRSSCFQCTKASNPAIRSDRRFTMG